MEAGKVTLIGLVGKPNAGKSTFFKASTSSDVEIANYPFTTIGSNRGVAFIRDECPHKELDVKCDPNNSRCINGTRFVPVQLIDVAGLVPGAYKGKGLGNEFLDQLRQADALIHVVDASGSTDLKGNPVESDEHDPTEDIGFLENEIKMWLYGILNEKWGSIVKKVENENNKLLDEISNKYTGIGIKKRSIKLSLNKTQLDQEKPSKWNKSDIVEVAEEIRKQSKPILISANKVDISSEENIKKITKKHQPTVPTGAKAELILQKAEKKGYINYVPGESSFEIIEPSKITEEQKKGLDFIKENILDKYDGTGVQKSLEKTVRDLLNMIVVYPVEDESDYTNKQGETLPDAYLLKKGSTPKDLARKIHSEIADKYLYAKDAKSGRRISDDTELKNGDVIKIVSSA
ncbi:MAG: Ribosome-binding ATPase YchF GTP1/OBG family [Candidatus Methanohalarchaeum thermophilum]|uniref:Ribosome-binding ATPase YchF GTP1/OBG family n=1 Tax=Methanohalarchaeum thermophilum TaxID=1903181 RepID=A0A1Q6DV28_METT1|nr:MAG: Ribosome-binding ATPase YchF GTP1/OBG family [Candidatus Methanohalarchaeum thermophilum]